jgi:hypothetical protein
MNVQLHTGMVVSVKTYSMYICMYVVFLDQKTYVQHNSSDPLLDYSHRID